MSEKPMDEHTCDIGELFTRLNSSKESGLNDESVKSNSNKYGKNFKHGRSVDVLRNGTRQQIDDENVVVGDVIFLKKDDVIPADIVIIEAEEMKVDQSGITGESEPQVKKAGKSSENPLESANFAMYMCPVMEGRGSGIVVRVGAETVHGMVANVNKSSKPCSLV